MQATASDVDSPDLAATVPVGKSKPMATHGLNGFHVYLVNIGTLFSIDFNANKMGIHDLCDLLLLKRFVLHHMTPMTGGVSNAD